jgi:hypothetical protein
MSNDWNRESEFRELCNAQRHYSNLRFLIIPVYVALNGGLAFGARDYLLAGRQPVDKFYFFGLFLLASIFFVVFRFIEIALNTQLDFLRSEFEKAYRESFWARAPAPRAFWIRGRFRKQVVHLHVMLLYWSMLLGWWGVIYVLSFGDPFVWIFGKSG